MRLFEFAGDDDVVDTLTSVLHQLLNQSDSKASTSELTYPAISQLLQRAGSYGMMDYKLFDKIYHENPQIQAVIQDYNGQRVKLATDKQPEKGPAGPNMAKTDQGVSQTTQQAASSGASATLKNS
jgi:hypothetical protein